MLNKNVLTKPVSFTMAFLATFMMALTTGCVSGGFKLTREYATWVNSQGVVLRVILYILTSIVFVITILIDVIINNTEDFWDGRVSQGIYKFNQDGRTYVAHHEFVGEAKLKRSTIRVTDSNDKLLQVVVFQETPSGEVELYVDGQLRTRVKNIFKAPVAMIFDKTGKKVEERVLHLNSEYASGTGYLFR